MPAAEPGERGPEPRYRSEISAAPLSYVWGLNSLHILTLTYLQKRIAGERHAAYKYEDFVPRDYVCIKDDDFLW